MLESQILRMEGTTSKIQTYPLKNASQLVTGEDCKKKEKRARCFGEPKIEEYEENENKRSAKFARESGC